MPGFSAPIRTTFSNVEPFANAGVGGINYLVLGCTGDAAGLSWAQFNLRFHVNVNAGPVLLVPGICVTAHFFASTSSGALPTADTVATWAGAPSDTVDNPPASVGYIWLRSDTYPLLPAVLPTALTTTLAFESTEPCVIVASGLPIASRLNIIAVLVASDWVCSLPVTTMTVDCFARGTLAG